MPADSLYLVLFQIVFFDQLVEIGVLVCVLEMCFVCSLIADVLDFVLSQDDIHFTFKCSCVRVKFYLLKLVLWPTVNVLSSSYLHLFTTCRSSFYN